MPLSKIHNTLTSDHILLDGTDSTGANANSKVLLDASASNTDVGTIMSFESGASDSSVTNTSTFLDDIKTTNRTAGRTVTLPDATGTVLTTGNSDTPTTTTSSSDADFVLIDDGGTMKKITPTD